jgi:curli biogenesis system outer membrane secretion channel CsgG
VAVLPFVCAPGGVRVAGAAVSCEEASSPCEQAIEGALAASRSFTVLGERDQPKLRQVRDDIEHRVASGRSEEIEAVKLGRELTADFVVLGKITRAEFTGQAGQRPQNVAAADTATATVEARMVNVSSSEVAWVKSTTVTLMGRDILLVRAGRSMKDPSEQALSPLQLAVSRAAAELADSLAKAFPVKLTAPSATAAPVLPGSK